MRTLRRRTRIISDNDFAGDPDGLLQLAHLLLSPTADVRAVIGGQLGSIDLSWTETSADASADAARDLARRCGRPDVRVVSGTNLGLASTREPRPSDAVDAIVTEAMRDDTDLPLYVACGGSLTNIASAWLVEPRIAERLTLVWIGGDEYDGHAEAPPDALPVEFNASIDALATQVVFNDSDLRMWQVPQNAYRQVLVSHREFDLRVRRSGPLGAYLFDAFDEHLARPESFGLNAGETVKFGDSPLVLLTVLQSPFFPEPSSSAWVDLPRPSVTEVGSYGPPVAGRSVRVFTRLDTRLLLEDFFAKLASR
jgi:purine nucleosidase